MALDKSFQKLWEGNDKHASWNVSGLFKSKTPLKTRLVQAQYQVRSIISRLDVYINRLEERDKALFERVVEALQHNDRMRATMYANEVAEIRKVAKSLLITQLALEQVSLRLETITEFGDVFVNLAPVLGVVRELKGVIKGIMPELGFELSELGENLQEVVFEAGEFTGGSGLAVASSPEAKKILEEATMIAEQKMKEKFPELPATASALGNKL
jgi:division protein CdvB (Snf7/Vps24/ESCRT-III family)